MEAAPTALAAEAAGGVPRGRGPGTGLSVYGLAEGMPTPQIHSLDIPSQGLLLISRCPLPQNYRGWP